MPYETTSHERSAEAIVKRATEEGKLLELLRGERPYVIPPDYMSCDFMPQNYEAMWQALKDTISRRPEIASELRRSLNAMLESPGDTYLLAYALITLLGSGNGGERSLGIIDGPALVAALKGSVLRHRDQLMQQPPLGGGLSCKWEDLGRLDRLWFETVGAELTR